MTSKKIKTKKKSAGISLMPYIVIACIIGLALTIYIAYRASQSNIKLYSVSLIALFAGLLFESYRISNNWKKVVAIFLGTYLISFINFLPGKREYSYDFESHIVMWPYVFIAFFAFFFGFAHKDKVTAKLTEGITLLLSISLIYWAVDYGFMNYHNWFSISLLTIGFIFSIYSIINALTHFHLSKTNRLVLSIWSTVIMFAFAIDNIIHVFNNPEIESSKNLSDGLYIGFQYFLLGVSAMYIIQNYMLLVNFLPRDLKENKQSHIDRYSYEQVNIGHSLFCIVFTVTFYWLNYHYQVLPRQTAIWLLLFAFPFILKLQVLIKRRSNNG